MSRLFGTDGIRGVANEEPLTPELAFRLGRQLVATLAEHGGDPRPARDRPRHPPLRARCSSPRWSPACCPPAATATRSACCPRRASRC